MCRHSNNILFHIMHEYICIHVCAWSCMSTCMYMEHVHGLEQLESLYNIAVYTIMCNLVLKMSQNKIKLTCSHIKTSMHPHMYTTPLQLQSHLYMYIHTYSTHGISNEIFSISLFCMYTNIQVLVYAYMELVWLHIFNYVAQA